MDTGLVSRNSFRTYPAAVNSDSIRLLRISQEPDGSFFGKLRTFPLYDAPPFFTASYVWGSKTFSQSVVIHLEPGKLPVLESLVPFLQLITEHYDFRESDWWWIDSLCINLEDGQEREEQVRIMGNIYKRAKRAIVWLGEEQEKDSDCEGAIDFLHELNQLRAALKELSTFRECLQRDVYLEKWAALSRLLSRSWWTRVWTLQEFILPKEAKLYCGQRRISRGKFKSAIYCVFLCSTSIPEHAQQYVPRLAFDSAFNRRRIHQWHVNPQANGMNLVALMAYLGNHSASDPRDRVYSVLGLVTGRDRRVAGIPEYTSTVERLYARLVRSFWEEFRSLDIICFTHLFNRYSGPDDLELEPSVPSWAPDWRVPTMFASPVPLMASASKHIGNFRPLHSRNYKALYSASGKWLREHANVKFSDSLRELRCDGVILDHIDGLGSLDDTDPRCRSFLCKESGHGMIQSQSDFCEDSFSPLDTLEAISNSLVLDRQDKYLRFAAPRYYVSDFVALCDLCLKGRQVDSLFSTWFENNKDFLIGGVTLQKTVEELLHSSDPLTLLSLPPPSAKLSSAPSLWSYSFPDSDAEVDDLDSFLSRFLDTVRKKSRRLMVTCDGYIGMAPCRARQGDAVAILFGCSIPLVLRPMGTEQSWQVIGECYVNDFMNREIEESMKRGDVQVDSFRLV
ncbi:hypothetical protein BS50DRAFT_85457 [Corynespora cassiicola Philippines]|uniref:Heterokaryon incompatibility domain-containing protein n=1 Tax=Corynespora cassiicola Philippines TaxID=1448308 RepID=A0A2T2NDW5_CORCC|nr:hypothetical protein BS50DRAFT_85457 [Corynespora cassiicola Philippines]